MKTKLRFPPITRVLACLVAILVVLNATILGILLMEADPEEKNDLRKINPKERKSIASEDYQRSVDKLAESFQVELNKIGNIGRPAESVDEIVRVFNDALNEIGESGYAVAALLFNRSLELQTIHPEVTGRMAKRLIEFLSRSELGADMKTDIINDFQVGISNGFKPSENQGQNSKILVALKELEENKKGYASEYADSVLNKHEKLFANQGLGAETDFSVIAERIADLHADTSFLAFTDNKTRKRLKKLLDSVRNNLEAHLADSKNQRTDFEKKLRSGTKLPIAHAQKWISRHTAAKTACLGLVEFSSATQPFEPTGEGTGPRSLEIVRKVEDEWLAWQQLQKVSYNLWVLETLEYIEEESNWGDQLGEIDARYLTPEVSTLFQEQLGIVIRKKTTARDKADEVSIMLTTPKKRLADF